MSEEQIPGAAELNLPVLIPGDAAVFQKAVGELTSVRTDFGKRPLGRHELFGGEASAVAECGK
jgi:hypothetical protein